MYETLSSGFESQKSWCLKLRSNVSWDWSSIYECSLCLKYLIFYFQEFICLFYQIHRWLFVNLQIRQNCFYIVLSVVRPRVDKNIFWHTVIFSPVSFSMWNTFVYLLSFYPVVFFLGQIGSIVSTMCEIHMFCLSLFKLQ